MCGGAQELEIACERQEKKMMLRFAPWMALRTVMPLTGRGWGKRGGLGDGFGLEPAGLVGQPAVEPLLMMGKGRPESKTQTKKPRCHKS